jgi:3-hydroxyisobutyrate dehydrogenase-like beta-hydroxyacid dehydrogenase
VLKVPGAEAIAPISCTLLMAGILRESPVMVQWPQIKRRFGDKSMTRIAFIGMGEAGGHLAQGLAGAGAEVRATYDILIEDKAKAPMLEARAKSLGILAASNAKAAVDGAEVVISAVVSNQMVVAARTVAPHLTAGQFYLDINSASPGMKREAAALVEASGADYVEAAVMDLVPPHGYKVPMLLAGKRAEALAAILSGLGMNVRAIGTNIGDASAIKMIRSVFMKGFTAILLECLTAANKLNAEEEILSSLQVSFPDLDWRKTADYYAPRLIKHSLRQAAEMHEVAETLEELGVKPITAEATAERLQWLADFGLADSQPALPKTYQEMLAMIRAAERN